MPTHKLAQSWYEKGGRNFFLGIVVYQMASCTDQCRLDRFPASPKYPEILFFLDCNEAQSVYCYECCLHIVQTPAKIVGTQSFVG